jgi:putative flippase GtrA
LRRSGSISLRKISDPVHGLWSKIIDLIRKLWSIQILRFFVVGGVNTAFGFAAFAGFILLGLPREVAVFLGLICGILFNFKTTGTIVFKNKDNRLIFRFFGVYLSTYLLTIGLLKLFDLYGIGSLVAMAIIVLPVNLLTFLLQRRFVFNTLDEDKKPMT